MLAHPVIPPLDRACDRYAPGRRAIARPVNLTGKGAALAGSLLLNLGLLAGVVVAMRVPDLPPAGVRDVLVSVTLRPEPQHSVVPLPPPERAEQRSLRKATPLAAEPEPLARRSPRPLPAANSATAPKAVAPVAAKLVAEDSRQAATPAAVTGKPDATGEFDQYRLMVWSRILASRPNGARSSGTVTLRFTLDGSGNIIDSRVERSSGQFLLDRLALQALRRAAPFPAPPQQAGDAPLAFTVPIKFH